MIPLFNRIPSAVSRPGLVCAAALTGLVSACATAPAEKLDRQAIGMGLTRTVATGSLFSHVCYRRPKTPGQKILHVYLDGDGTPWRRHRVVSADPTPREPLVLRLMSQDPDESIYLGRPCYHGLSKSPSCNPSYWTHARYSEEVVHSMETALRGIVVSQAYTHLVFVGFSGGGTLAMLLAPRFDQTRAVLTLAANLDPHAWAAYHHYSPLSQSLNPSRLPPLPGHIVQLHFAGANDTNIPPQMIRAASRRQRLATLEVLKGFDHRCCWKKAWPAILSKLSQALRENLELKATPTQRPGETF